METIKIDGEVSPPTHGPAPVPAPRNVEPSAEQKKTRRAEMVSDLAPSKDNDQKATKKQGQKGKICPSVMRYAV